MRYTCQDILELFLKRSNTVLKLSVLVRDFFLRRGLRRTLDLSEMGLKRSGATELGLCLVTLAASQSPLELVQQLLVLSL